MLPEQGASVITLVALISFPLIAAFLLLMVRAPRLRSVIVVVCSILISLGSMSLIASRFALPAISLSVPQETLSVALLALELGLCALILVLSIRHGKPLAGLLAVIQTALMTSAEVFFGGTPHGDTQLMADKLSVIIAVIVGVVGSLITVYALSYMKAHHARHPEVKDRRRFFFFLQFVFLSAMFGILFSNDLTLLHFFWEVTTLCSFLLIGYNGDTEGRNKAFLSLNMNLIGGIAFAAAILWASANFGIMQLDTLINSGKAWGLVPAMLLALAGMTKSAQLPFSSWLLGAMVAPTPVSALLHSSTMVKAGVYLMLRLAPVLQGSLPGVMVALVGGVTFLLTSLAAISQRDAKRVLAYSTIGNLALVVLCAGVGTYEAVWAGILLILFHAVTKCLLFLCVGSYEQKRGTRDIESMSGLIISMPRLSIMVQIGIAGMFLAPFGMLVSKWAVLKALVDFNPLLAVFVVFGSSATLFF
jgi:ech hydrogenase subunit A